MTFADAPDLLTVPEAAALARCGRNQMYQAVSRGDVFAASIGRSVRIPKLALSRWLLGPFAGEGGTSATTSLVPDKEDFDGSSIEAASTSS